MPRLIHCNLLAKQEYWDKTANKITWNRCSRILTIAKKVEDQIMQGRFSQKKALQKNSISAFNFFSCQCQQKNSKKWWRVNFAQVSIWRIFLLASNIKMIGFWRFEIFSFFINSQLLSYCIVVLKTELNSSIERTMCKAVHFFVFNKNC